MNVEPPIPAELWAEVPPHVQAALLAAFGHLERRIAPLQARLGRDSSQDECKPLLRLGPVLIRKNGEGISRHFPRTSRRHEDGGPTNPSERGLGPADSTRAAGPPDEHRSDQPCGTGRRGRRPVDGHQEFPAGEGTSFAGGTKTSLSGDIR
jgi:hypothetical protein